MCFHRVPLNEVTPIPKNIYGVTKTAAEALCELFYRNHGLPCLILRTSRFFPEVDDRKETREAYQDGNIKANELLYRRVDLEDVVSAHLLALEKAARSPNPRATATIREVELVMIVVSDTSPIC